MFIKRGYGRSAGDTVRRISFILNNVDSYVCKMSMCNYIQEGPQNPIYAAISKFKLSTCWTCAADREEFKQMSSFYVVFSAKTCVSLTLTHSEVSINSACRVIVNDKIKPVVVRVEEWYFVT